MIADMMMERINKWRHQAEVKKVTIVTMGTTEEITRSSFQNEVCLHVYLQLNNLIRISLQSHHARESHG